MTGLSTAYVVSVIVSAALTFLTTAILAGLVHWFRQINARLASIEQYQRDHAKDHQLAGSTDRGRHRQPRRW